VLDGGVTVLGIDPQREPSSVRGGEVGADAEVGGAVTGGTEWWWSV